MMELLRKLTEAFGPSGNEEQIGDIIINEIKDYADEIKRDRLGNVIALKRGTGIGRVMISTHMDQIGVMVTSIDKEGFLRFTSVGYVNPFNSLAQNIIFKNGVTGTVGREEKKEIKDLKLDNLYIDIGAANKEEAEEKIRIGDFGVFKSNFIANGNRVSSGALDDRIGCYVAVETLKGMKECSPDIYFVFTVQEESYLSGAATSAYAIEPDCAIVVDVTATGDTPNCHPMDLKLGEGAAIKIMDRGMISHPRVKNYLIDTAKRYNIKIQLEVLEGGATDGAEIHISKSGVPTGGISIPTRYIHSPQEIVDLKDVESAVRLLTEALADYKEL